MTDLVHAADQSQSKLPDRQSEIRVLKETLLAKTDAEEKEEKKMLDRDMDDIGEGSARGTVRTGVILGFVCCVGWCACTVCSHQQVNGLPESPCHAPAYAYTKYMLGCIGYYE